MSKNNIRAILELHRRDIFNLLLKNLIAVDSAAYCKPEDHKKLQGLLEDYLKTQKQLDKIAD